ncbi:MAG: hypothetical protein WD623_16895 [Marinobacter sp.]|uniref:hypothetical protein n=1 Tax=Marinobacter sp. TaxID=50741 RepID=UPI00349FE176
MQLAVEEQGWDPIPSVSEASRINLTADQPEQYTAALERGERCLYKKFVCGFGVSLRKVGPVVPSAPTSRQEAEQICTAMLGQFPDAKVCQVSITEDGLAETQCPLPGDYFHIEYICESQPGKWGLNTDLSHHTYRDAVTRMATLREKGYLGVQLLRIRADE